MRAVLVVTVVSYVCLIGAILINKPRKQSLRQTVDRALSSDDVVEPAEPKRKISKSIDRPVYVRGALVKALKSTNARKQRSD